MNIKIEKYRDFRKHLLGFVKNDLVGPSKDDEIITENPSWRYVTGMLYPQTSEVSEESPESDEENAPDMTFSEDGLGGSIERTSSYYPSAMGLSFLLPKKCNGLSVRVEAGKYKKMSLEKESGDFKFVKSKLADCPSELANDEIFREKCTLENGLLTLKEPISTEDRDHFLKTAGEHPAAKNAIWRVFDQMHKGWRREKVKGEVEINPAETKKEEDIAEGLKAIYTSQSTNADFRICTLAVFNSEVAAKPQSDSERIRFQVIFFVSTIDGSPFIDLRKSRGKFDVDDEELSLDLLYRNRPVYAAGHGCSADWEVENGEAKLLSTESLPSYEIPQMVFGLPEGTTPKPDLNMYNLANKEDAEVLQSLKNLVGGYEEWIGLVERETKEIERDLQEIAGKHLKLCREASERMKSGITLLSETPDCMRAFKLANLAMHMQRCHSDLQRENVFPDEDRKTDLDYPSKEHSWRPFQIAFLLLSLEGITSSESDDRNIVDLIWFPTGGGKTEAYLGVTAFTIFLRRMRNPQNASGGTTVIMRYTLRLLTSQQFQRACTLICACEAIRQQEDNLGEEPVSIGLWLGSSSTPNNIVEANRRVQQLSQQDGANNNPFQLLSCPWCGTHMVKRGGRGYNCYEVRRSPKRFVMRCPNSNCIFVDALPVQVVDEDIYNRPPSLLFGTVDKFANLPWLEKASSLFALSPGMEKLPSPELIIQDELHLISGALGTMVGLYETAIDLLCSQKGRKPKIIASTATVRRAAEQAKALYGRELSQFPPLGIDAADSYFAREDQSTTPGRLYVGIMPSGKTFTTTQVRLMADIMQGVKLLEGEDEKDPYWTQVVYCNSIRELGRSKTITFDDVQEYSTTICRRKGEPQEQRHVSFQNVEELTSRIPAEYIPEILKRLFTEYPKKTAIDILLATNMISVGVDVDRLGLMTILGQPKTTSEYIQASSRVGRKFPGIVCTLYSSVKSRDRSHYERFRQYHQSIYRHVEPTSVTPFSPPARDKALHAVIITLIRHAGGMHGNDSLPDFDGNAEEVQRLVSELMKRVSSSGASEDEIRQTEAEIKSILDEISIVTHGESGSVFSSKNEREKMPLLKTMEGRERGRFPTPQSMRSTDAEALIYVENMNYGGMKSRIPKLRRSQAITTFGIGAIVDLPLGSVMMCGIEKWPKRGCIPLEDRRLEKKLQASFFLMPPDSEISNEGLQAVRFPRWMRCPNKKCAYLRDIDEWRQLWKESKGKGDFDEKPRCHACKIPLIPSRFVVACKHGHINDFPFFEWVHGNKKCEKPRLRYVKTGSSAALSGIRIECDCGEKMNMGRAFSKETLNQITSCKGGKPWVNLYEGPCKAQEIQTLQRGGTNVHYPLVASSILIPPYSAESMRGRIVSTGLWERFESSAGAISEEKIAEMIAFEINEEPNNVLHTIHQMINPSSVEEEEDEEKYRYEEYCAFLGDFDKKSYAPEDFLVEEGDAKLADVEGMEKIILARKLREIRAQTGFTRITPLGGSDEEYGDSEPPKKVSVSNDRGVRWLPAYQVRGEGIFLSFSSDILEKWAGKKEVAERVAPLMKRAATQGSGFGPPEGFSPQYILLHSLAHALIRQLSFDCGYSSSALRERIYCSKPGSRRQMHGFLIYTAQGDSDGTMGGLVSRGNPHDFRHTFFDAIRNANWCSSDPLCLGSGGQGFKAMSLAACHACSMLPETACECMNMYLDRALLVGTLDNPGIGFFTNWLERYIR